MSKSIIITNPINQINYWLEQSLKGKYFKIEAAYNITVEPNWKIEDRVLDHYHLLFLRNGNLTYVCDGEEISLNKGDIIFISDQVRHQAYKSTSIHVFSLRFRSIVYPGEVAIHTELPFFFKLTPRDSLFFQRCFEQAYRCFKKYVSLERLLLSNANIVYLLTHLIKELKDTSNRIDLNEKIKTIKELLDEYPSGHLSIRDLAESAGFTPRYISKKFKEQYGFSIKEYQIKKRIDVACYLLESSKMSIKEVSEQLGYQDPFTFSKQFKQIEGLSPSIYARKIMR